VCPTSLQGNNAGREACQNGQPPRCSYLNISRSSTAHLNTQQNVIVNQCDYHNVKLTSSKPVLPTCTISIIQRYHFSHTSSVRTDNNNHQRDTSSSLCIYLGTYLMPELGQPELVTRKIKMSAPHQPKKPIADLRVLTALYSPLIALPWTL
jgi:hypothetical protein